MIINKAIIHVLDKSNDGPILNDFDLRLAQEIESFYQKAIKRVLNDDHLRRVVFNDYDDNIIKKCCENIIYNEDSFVENSQEIAAFLFDIMKISSDLESCDLAVCLFNYEDQRYVGIFKIDYKKHFTHSINVVDEKFKIQMVSNHLGIQETYRFKNAAIVGISGLNDEYHLMTLDKDAEKKETTSSWLAEFINGITIADEKFNTRTFKKVTDNWLSNVMSNDIKKSESIRSYMNHLLKNEEEISLEEFADNTIADKDLKDEFKDLMKERSVEDNFTIDKDWVSKNLKKKSIATDSGFTLRANLDDFNDPSKYSLKQNPDGSFDITIKNVNAYEVK